MTLIPNDDGTPLAFAPIGRGQYMLTWWIAGSREGDGGRPVEFTAEVIGWATVLRRPATIETVLGPEGSAGRDHLIGRYSADLEPVVIDAGQPATTSDIALSVDDEDRPRFRWRVSAVPGPDVDLGGMRIVGRAFGTGRYVVPDNEGG